MSTPLQREYWHPGAFIKHLTEKRGIPQHRAVEIHGDYEVYALDLTGLQLNVSSFTPFVVNKRLSAHSEVTGERIEELLPELHQFLRKSESQFIVLVIGGKLEQASADLVRHLRGSGIAVIDRKMIANILGTKDQRTTLSKLAEPLVHLLGRDVLSPYLAGRIATAGRFFGRVDVLNRTVTGKFGGNFTIMGNRRIGKTSLLKEIKRRLLRDDEHLRTADVYGNNCNSSFDVVKKILEQVRPDLVNRMFQDPSLIESLPTHLSSLGDNVAVFIDELDHVLAFDAGQKYQLLELLRATFEHERCRVFFSGFRRVMQAKKTLETPLHNFTRFIPLGGLSRAETYDMVTGPLSRLGIKLDAELPSSILKETSGHPELIQIFCSKVIDYYREHDRAPTTNDLLSEVSSDENFRTTVYSTFLRNTNPFEKLLCYCLFRRAASEGTRVDGFEFTIRQCDEVLKAVSHILTQDELETVTQNLRVGGVIVEVKGAVNRFRFAVPRLAEYCISHDLDWSIGKTKEELALRPEAISLHLEPEGISDGDLES